MDKKSMPKAKGIEVNVEVDSEQMDAAITKAERLVELLERANKLSSIGAGLNLYKVSNGYMGYGYIHVIVIAGDEEEAEELAARKFKEHADEHADKYPGVEPYDDDYWTHLRVGILKEDISEPFVSRVVD